jgi:Ca2+-binding RTX toxin-like protein
MAATMTPGDDTIIGTAAQDILFGDTRETLADAARGGNDRLSGGAGDDSLIGDAFLMVRSLCRAGHRGGAGRSEHAPTDCPYPG